jgi:hypothetical protein
MADSPATTSDGVFRTLDIFGKQYGPYAFGIASLLILWVFVVAPELKAAKFDTAAMSQIAATQQKTADTLERAIATQQATTHVLDKLAERIERSALVLERAVGPKQ